jgi:hypothetical protein
MKLQTLALLFSASSLLVGNAAQAFEAKQIALKQAFAGSDLKVVLVDGTAFATYQYFQAEEMPFDSSIAGTFAGTCRTTRKEATDGALALCAKNGGVDCRIATMFKQVQKVATKDDSGKPAVAVQCTYTTYAIDLHNPTDKIAVYDESGPMYP